MVNLVKNKFFAYFLSYNRRALLDFDTLRSTSRVILTAGKELRIFLHHNASLFPAVRMTVG